MNGLAAGAVGTSLLNTVTYLDMALRGRPSSSLPAEDVEEVSDRAGVSLGSDEDTASARKEALGALLGFVTGFAGGVAYAAARPLARNAPWPAAAALTGVGVMLATDLTSTALGTTDPRSWSPADWLSDAVPHLAYGAGVVLSYDALRG
jgi:drug/metabolite transporter (DMT)-like permease